MKTLRLPVIAMAIGGLVFPAVVQGQSSKEAARVRVLLVLDTLDKLGATWSLDGVNMKAMLEHNFARQGLKAGKNFTLDVFTGNKVTPKEILEYYRKLDVQANEALVFYYSGHGGYHLNKGHFLALTIGHQHLYRADLLAAMNTKQPRLRAVLTDCCANISGGALAKEPKNHAIEARLAKPGPANRKAPQGEPEATVVAAPDKRPSIPSRPDVANLMRKYQPAKTTEPPAQVIPTGLKNIGKGIRAKKAEPAFTLGKGTFIRTPKGSVPLQEVLDKADGKIMRQLFFQQKGLIDINGSLKGESSFGQQALGGSFFTLAFIHLQAENIRTLDINNNGFVEWNEFIPAWVDLTKRISRAATQKKNVQTPETWHLQVAK